MRDGKPTRATVSTRCPPLTSHATCPTYVWRAPLRRRSGGGAAARVGAAREAGRSVGRAPVLPRTSPAPGGVPGRHQHGAGEAAVLPGRPQRAVRRRPHLGRRGRADRAPLGTPGRRRAAQAAVRPPRLRVHPAAPVPQGGAVGAHAALPAWRVRPQPTATPLRLPLSLPVSLFPAPAPPPSRPLPRAHARPAPRPAPCAHRRTQRTHPSRSKSWLAPGTRRWAALRALAQVHAQRPDESEQACIRRCWRGCARPRPRPLARVARLARSATPRPLPSALVPCLPAPPRATPCACSNVAYPAPRAAPAGTRGCRTPRASGTASRAACC